MQYAMLSFCQKISALESALLTVHILNNNVENFAERRAVFKHLPRLVGVVMDFNQILITCRNKAVAIKIVYKIIVNIVLVKTCALNEKLGVLSVFKHFFVRCAPSFLFYVFHIITLDFFVYKITKLFTVCSLYDKMALKKYYKGCFYG